MAFPAFTSLDDVLRKYQIRHRKQSFAGTGPFPPPSDHYLAELRYTLTSVPYQRSEAFACEALIYPTPREVWRHYAEELSFFSHETVHADADLFMLAATVFYALRYDQPLRERAWNKFKLDRVPEQVVWILAAALNADADERPEDVAAMRGFVVESSRAEARLTSDEAEDPGDFPMLPMPGDEELAVLDLLSWEAKEANLRVDIPSPETLVAGSRVEIILPGKVPMAFAWCPAGSFQMASPRSEQSRSPDEVLHEVELTRGLCVCVHPATQEQWNAVIGSWGCDNPSHFQGSSLPVDSVSWDDAVAFCQKASAVTAWQLRLPTEAEWEYAARGGTTTPFYWGTALDGTQANCDARRLCYPYVTGSTGHYDASTTPVGRYATEYPHPWGLTDAHGNVWEWCEDWFNGAWYGRSPLKSPICRFGRKQYRSTRGGSWSNDPAVCRAGWRMKELPESRNNNLGFRVVFCLV